MSQARDVRRRIQITASRRFVIVAFATVGSGALIATLFAIVQTRMLEQRARDIVDDMLTSVRLVGQMESEAEKQQVLLDEHILATDPAEMRSLEAQLTALDAQIAATMRAYDPWADQPGERAAWNRTRADLMALQAPAARAIALSRQDRDLEARQVMLGVAARFKVVEGDLDQLVSINHRGATASLSRFSMIRFRLVLTLLGIGLVGLLGTVLVGRWVARQVGRREEEMAREAKMLEDRNRELDAFAGRVSHDIRGPLTSISLAATTLAATVPQEVRATEILRRGIKRMGAIVDDLLTLARVEAQGRGRCDPTTVVAELKEDLATRLESEKGALRVAVDHAEVSCSEGLLRQALTNVTENAVKYRRPDLAPQLEISGAAIDGQYVLRVSDNGVGMSAEEARLVFEPFYRSPRTQALPGTGLGLSIVDRIVKANGGTLSIETQLGQGSTFILRLPLAEPPGPAKGARRGVERPGKGRLSEARARSRMRSVRRVAAIRPARADPTRWRGPPRSRRARPSPRGRG